LILAGKAHPDDEAGQALIRDWVSFIRRADIRPHAIFLSDYDMQMSERLVAGVDVWINTPRRPWEACGTSGMKVLVNGGLNISELDGWWAEAYAPDVGWALGDRKEHDDDQATDQTDANQLYGILENEIIPAFYARDEGGVPRPWVARIRESMASLTPRFSANRSVREYVDNCYLPAATAYRQRALDNGALAAKICEWQRTTSVGWNTLRIGRPQFRTRGDLHDISVDVDIGTLDVESLRVELYADAEEGSPEMRQEMSCGPDRPTSSTVITYFGSVSASRAAQHYTVRITPFHPGVHLPIEDPHILWQR
jgi:starch phosphorylase